MGLKTSKAEKKKNKEEIEEESDDESETLEIMKEGDCDEECEESEESSKEWFRGCKKTASMHNKSYIPIKNLSLEHFPEPIRHESILSYVQLRAQLVVRVLVHCTSSSRSPDKKDALSNQGKTKGPTRMATGYAWIYCQDPTESQCPDESCKIMNKHEVYRGILITTNRHVIFDNEEAKKTKIQFFYDDKNSTVVEGTGYCLREDLERKDYVSLKIFFHDRSLFYKICKINEDITKLWESIPCDLKLEMEKRAIIISHAHGKYKKVTIGELLDVEIPDRNTGRKVTRYTSITCTGSSGAPVLTGLYWTNPFVHSSGLHNKRSKTYTGLSFSY